jgi:hypothetical protein
MKLLLITSAMLNVFMAMIMAVFYFSRKTFPGFNFWMGGVAATALTYGNLALRGTIPFEISIFLTNIFWPLTGLLYLDGLRRFLGFSKLPWWIYVVPLLVAINAISTIYYFNSGVWRTIVITVAFSIPHGLTAWLGLREYANLKSIFLLILGLETSVATAAAICRALFNLTVPNFEFMISLNSELFFFITFITLELVICFSFIMLNAEWFERDLLVTQSALESNVQKLEKALAEVKTLRGLLPICSNCKKICDDNSNWVQVEAYVRDRTDADFSHSICPDCLKKLYPEFADSILDKTGTRKKKNT